MGKADNLLEKLNNSQTEKIAENEREKHLALEDAHNTELIKRSENRTRLGRFAVDLTIYLISAASVLVVLMVAFYSWQVIQNPLKLEQTLFKIYNELKLFVSEYQAVIAVIATLMFGDKLKRQ